MALVGKNGICCFSAKHATLKSKSKEWLARNEVNVHRVEQHVYLWTGLTMNKHYKHLDEHVSLIQCEHYYHQSLTLVPFTVNSLLWQDVLDVSSFVSYICNVWWVLISGYITYKTVSHGIA